MPFDLLVFTKNIIIKLLNIIVNKDYKEGMGILHKEIYKIINNFIDINNIKIENAKTLNVFADRIDHNMGMKYINSKYAYKIMEMNRKELIPIDLPIKKEKEFTPITSFSDFKNQLAVAVKNEKEQINKVKSKNVIEENILFINYDD